MRHFGTFSSPTLCKICPSFSLKLTLTELHLTYSATFDSLKFDTTLWVACGFLLSYYIIFELWQNDTWYCGRASSFEPRESSYLPTVLFPRPKVINLKPGSIWCNSGLHSWLNLLSCFLKDLCSEVTWWFLKAGVHSDLLRPPAMQPASLEFCFSIGSLDDGTFDSSLFFLDPRSSSSSSLSSIIT